MKSKCETIQLSISDKLDESIALDHSEKEHLVACPDCQQFYHFVQGQVFQSVANVPAERTFDIETVSLAATIMNKLSQEEKMEVKRSKIISISLATAAAAAIAAVTISQVIQPASLEDGSQVKLENASPEKAKMSVSKETIAEINFDEKYAVINEVVVNRIATVSYSIKKIKECFAEGNAFLDEHTQNTPENTPESYFYLPSVSSVDLLS